MNFKSLIVPMIGALLALVVYDKFVKELLTPKGYDAE